MVLENYRQYLVQQTQSGGEKTMQSLLSIQKSRTNYDKDYEDRLKIGQGTFGEVFKAKYKQNDKQYALKKMRFNPRKEGFPIGLIRELRLLMKLKHENIVEFKDFRKKQSSKLENLMEVYLVFELCQYDLAGLINKDFYFSMAQRKSIMQQLLTGLCFIHDHKYIHRDLKSANILISHAGVVKIADFGLSRHMPPLRNEVTMKGGHNEPTVPMSPNVITLWYRAPELLLSYPLYSSAVDMWGVGCIMFEIWVRSPLFRGNEEMVQLRKILELCGPITADVWPDVEKCQAQGAVDVAKNFKTASVGIPGAASSQRMSRLQVYLANQMKKPDSALQLVENLLHLNPKKRFNCQQALGSSYFSEEPAPGGLQELSKVVQQPAYEMGSHRKRPADVRPGVVPPAKMPANNFPQPLDSVRTVIY